MLKLACVLVVSIETILDKFAPIGFTKLYHGVNPAMTLYFCNSLNVVWGPLSATVSYHVACTFATDKGMVVEMHSQYPTLPYCYAFDASKLSDYPEYS